jgi:hypothetical protein
MIFDVMTRLMICDIGFLYMCIVITYFCVCCNFYMPVLEAPQSGRWIKKIFKKNYYVHRLCSSENPKEYKGFWSSVCRGT